MSVWVAHVISSLVPRALRVVPGLLTLMLPMLVVIALLRQFGLFVVTVVLPDGLVMVGPGCCSR